MFNSFKLREEDDQLELRMMDEFIAIEKYVGEIKGIIGLQFLEQSEFAQSEQIEFLDKEEAPKKKTVINDEGEEVEVEEEEKAPEEEEEQAKPKFKPEDFKWTMSNRNQRNLPQLFT